MGNWNFETLVFFRRKLEYPEENLLYRKGTNNKLNTQMAMKISCLVNPSWRHWAYLTRPPLQYTFPKMVLYIAFFIVFPSSWAPFRSNKVNKLFSNHIVQ